MNKFNCILLSSGLAATASLMAISPAFAGTTGKVDLSGTVPSTLTITVTPSSNSASLDLSPGSRIVKIGTITGATTNSATGLKVTATSSWKLVSGENVIAIGNFYQASGATATTHTMNHDSALPDGQAIELGYTKSTSSGLAPDSSIFIYYNVPSTQAAGNYTGSITFTAADR